MLRKLATSLLFGAAFAIAFLVVVELYLEFKLQNRLKSSFDENESVVAEVPKIPKPEKKFLGSRANWSSEFIENRNGVLASGPGEIRGLVSSNGKPTQGLRLRLVLNGKVVSQWSSTTNNIGEYVISVPYGEYRIDGYELDNKLANEVLAGLIESEVKPYTSRPLAVDINKQRDGINFRFIDPVIKTVRRTAYDINEPVVISWKPYADAVTYNLQVYQLSSPDGYPGNNNLFGWSSRPQVEETEIDLKNYTPDLKSGYYYLYEIRAFDVNGQQISRSAKVHRGYDFEIYQRPNNSKHSDAEF